MNEDIHLYLPWPPTVNSYYGTSRSGHKYISSKGRAFRENIEAAVQEQIPGLQLDQQLFVEVYLHAPDNRRRDLDNYMKALLDALTIAGVWEDDKQIDQLHIYRGSIEKNGVVRMEISEAGPVIPF